MQNEQEKLYASRHQLQPVKHFPWLRKGFNIFGILFFVFCVVAAVVCVWAILHRTPNNLTTILVTVIIPILGIVYSYLQVHLVVNPPHSGHLPSPIAAAAEQASSQSTTIPNLSSLNPMPPATTSRVIQQPKGIVKDLYKLVSQRDVTAVVLTGIAGVGKSTLAALLFQRFRANSNWPFSLHRFFTAPPLWFEVKSTSTFNELAGELYKHAGRSLPADFLSQPSDVKASLLLKALEQSRRVRLIVLDQFDNWLEWNTGLSLPDHPDIDALLNAINNQQCKNKFLLTSRIRPRIRPRGAHISTQAYTREFLFKRLEVDEAVKLLQVGEVDGTEIELQKVVRNSDGHAGALAGLVTLLKDDEPSLDFHSIRCIQHWMRKIHETVFKSLFQQLDYYEQDLLFNFSVYRTPIPLQIAVSAQTQIIDDTWDALDTLLKQHLFQKSNNGYYRLHPIVARCTQYYLYQANKQGLKFAHDQAGLYYQSLGWKPQGMRQRKEDIQHLLELVWHLCNAERKEEAQDLAQRENIRADLIHWEDQVTLLELQELLA
jgi:AAA domain